MIRCLKEKVLSTPGRFGLNLEKDSWHKMAKVSLIGLWDMLLIRLFFVTMINVLLECWDFCFAGNGVAEIMAWLFDVDSRNLRGLLCSCYWFWHEDQIDHLQDHFELNRTGLLSFRVKQQTHCLFFCTLAYLLDYCNFKMITWVCVCARMCVFVWTRLMSRSRECVETQWSPCFVHLTLTALRKP